MYDKDSRVLILGSFPSVKAREEGFYYPSGQNRFWKLLAYLLEEPVPGTEDEKRRMLLARHIALWDVAAECDIKGSGEQSIRNVIPNDLNRILRTADIKTIITNGGTAHRLYRRYAYEHTGREAVKCPSTSASNVLFTLERLAEQWREAMER